MKNFTLASLIVYLTFQTALAFEQRFFETCYRYDDAIHCSKAVAPPK